MPPLAIRCPTCGAPPGAPRPGPTAMLGVHYRRALAAESLTPEQTGESPMPNHITDPYLNRAALSATPGTPTEAVPCSVCMAAPGQPCSTLTADGTGRRAVTWLHEDRVPRESYPSRYGVGVADEAEGFGAAL